VLETLIRSKRFPAEQAWPTEFVRVVAALAGSEVREVGFCGVSWAAPSLGATGRQGR